MKLFKRLWCKLFGHVRDKDGTVILTEAWGTMPMGPFRPLGELHGRFITCARCGTLLEAV